MNLLDQFISILSAQKPTPSRATVKNYKADVSRFIAWYKSNFGEFIPASITSQVLELYKTAMTSQTSSGEGLALRSIERHLSSLRKFFNFLKVAGHIERSPFEMENDKSKMENADPYQLKGFRDHLYVFNASDLTIKNYINDVKQFFAWAEKVTGLASHPGKVVSNDRIQDQSDSGQARMTNKDIFKYINTPLLEEYRDRLQHEAGLSPVSINRKLSSLRRYLSFAQAEGLITNGGLEISNDAIRSPLNVRQGVTLENNSTTNHNNTDQISNTQPEVITKPRYSNVPPIRLFQRIGHVLGLGFEAVLIAPLASLALKLHMVKWHLSGASVFIKQNSKLKVSPLSSNNPLTRSFAKMAQDDKFGIVNLKNFGKGMFAPHAISLAGLPWHKKAWHHARYTRPKWYKRYHENPITHYFHFAILVIVMTALGVGMYQAFVNDPATKGLVKAAPVSPPRILSFQGRLTDASDNPITTAATPLRFAIYNDLSASGAALLWQEIVSVSPDTDGIFSVLLGNNTTIPQSLFGDNASLYLGITVQSTSELTPRQQIATVPYATNSELLQGMPPITDVTAGTTNVILALNSSGNLAIGGSATPVFQATGGSFTLQGTTTIISTTTGSNGNVRIIPDGLGKIDLQKPIQNSTNNNNVVGAAGSVEINDSFSVLGTTSASLVTLEQQGTGPLISASVSGVAKFTVLNTGQLSIPVYNTAGGILYGTSTGLISQTIAGTASQCLLGGTTPTFGSCATNTDDFWDQANGALYPSNSTVDLLIGGQATTSAKFAVLNVNNGTPTASVSSGVNGTGMYMTADGTLATTRRTTLTIGNSSTYDTTGNVLINPNGTGNVGIGTTNPTAKLDVAGNITLSGTTGITLTGSGADIAFSAGTNTISSSGTLEIGAHTLTGAITGNNQNVTGLGNLSAAGTITFSTFNANNASLYATVSTGILAAASTNTTNLCLISGATAPAWASCNTGTNDFYWSQANGSLYTNNSTVDLLIGGQSTASAKFAIINMNTGNPTATISGNLALAVPTTAGANTLKLLNNSTLHLQTSVGGDAGATSRLYIGSDGTGGNIGIGTTAPGVKLDVVGGTIRTDADIYGGDLYLGYDDTTATITTNDTDENLTIDPNGTGTITLTTTTLTLSGTTTITAASLDTLTSAATLGVSATTLNLGAGAAATIGTISDDNLSLSPNGTGDIRLVNDADTSIIMPGFTSNGGVLYTDGSGVLAQATAGTSTQCLIGGTTPTFGSCGGFWDQQNGALYPNNSTVDLLIGGQSTASAKFAIINMNAGNPTATMSGNLSLVTPTGGAAATKLNILNGGSFGIRTSNGGDAGLSERISLLQNGNVGIGITNPGFLLEVNGTARINGSTTIGDASGDSLTVNAATLSLINASTLDLVDSQTSALVIETTLMNFDTANSRIGIGTTTPTAKLDVNGAASVSGTLSFRNTATSAIVATQLNDLTIGDSATGKVILNPSGNIGIGLVNPAQKLDVFGNFKVSGTTTFNTVAYTWPGADGSSGYALTTNGAGTLSWSPSGSLGTNHWGLTNGSLYPFNSTVDLLIGGQSSASAKFAVLNVNSGTPTASVSAGTAGGTYLTADGKLATTAKQTLTLGDSTTTGDILINPSGNIGIKTTASPGFTLEVNGTARINGNTTLGDASGDSVTINAATLSLVNATTLDLANTQTSALNIEGGLLNFDTTNSFIGMGTTTPTAKLDVRGSATISATLSLGPMLQINAGACTVSAAGKLYYDGTANQYYYCNGSAWTAVGSGSGTSWWNMGNGLLYPINATLDLAIGGTSTSAAKFAFINVNSGNPTASIAGNLALAVPTTAGANTLKLLNNSTLNIQTSVGGDAGATASRLFIASDGAGGNVGIGTTAPSSLLEVNGAAEINGNTTLGDASGDSVTINAATLSLVNASTLNLVDSQTSALNIESGLLNFDTNNSFIGIGTTVPGSKLGVAGNLSVGATYGAIAAPVSGLIVEGNVGIGTTATLNKLDVNGSAAFGTYAGTAAPANGLIVSGNLGIGTTAPAQKLSVAGSATISATLSLGPLLQVDAGACSVSTAGKMYYDAPTNSYYFCNGSAWTQLDSGSFWTQSNGALFPHNSTVDLFIGGQSTASAKFAALNMNGSGTPTASVSSGINGTGMYMTADGTLATTKRTNLTIGNSSIYNTTGNVLLNPNGTGNVGIGTTNPERTLDVMGYSSFKLNSTGDKFRIIPQSAGSGIYLSSVNNAENAYAPLRIDGSTLILQNGSAGNVGISTTAPIAKLDIRSDLGTAPAASVSANSNSFAAMVIDNSGLGSLLTASRSGDTRFTVTNLGDVIAKGQIQMGNYTTAQAASLTPVGRGALYYNTTDNQLYISNDGTTWSTLSGQTTIPLTNTSGGSVTQYSIVIQDTTADSSFTTTTTAYNTKVIGIMSSSTCASSAICLVTVSGETTVRIANDVARGDYIYTSTTAGQAFGSAKLSDGMLGVALTSGSAGGTVDIVLIPQLSSLASAMIDKASKHNEYRMLANDYLETNTGTSPNMNVPADGIFFDNFTDNSKVGTNAATGGPWQQNTPKANTSTAPNTPVAPFRTGLVNGQTYATSTTDNNALTYLGSNTVNKIAYYDRTRDSSAAVQVNLGIDPNWYNGVTLSVASTSSTFSQNDTNPNQQVNPNLSTSYNGSVLLVSGQMSTSLANPAKTVFVTVKSTTANTITFDWSDGSVGKNAVTATFAQLTELTTQGGTNTGVFTRFMKAKYNSGDVFRIASWYIENTTGTTTRGSKAQFPERSYIVGGGVAATSGYLDIIDADTQKLWMRFSSTTASAYPMIGTRIPLTSVTALNGHIYVGQGSTGGVRTIPFEQDTAYYVDASLNYKWGQNGIASRNNNTLGFTANWGPQPYTNSFLVDSSVNDVAAAVIPDQPKGTVTVSGWGWFNGGTTAETVTLPYKFNTTPSVVITAAGYPAASAVPTSLASCTTQATARIITAKSIATNSFIANMDAVDGSNAQCYSWTATGEVSPRQYVAVGTGNGITANSGGATIINETDQSSVNIIQGSVVSAAVHPNKVALLSDGTLYVGYGNANVGSLLMTYYNIGGITSNETTWLGYIGGYYGFGATPGTWTPAVNGTYAAGYSIKSLSATQGTSTIDGTSNTVYIGTDQGVTVLQEKQSHGTINATQQGEDGKDESSGSVKYYTKDYISEEMVEDIRDVHAFAGSGTLAANTTLGSTDTDISIKANAWTTSGASNQPTRVSGVRGNALKFDGTDDYVCTGTTGTCANDADLNTTSSSLSVGAWIKRTSTTGDNDAIMAKYGATNADRAYYLVLGATDLPNFITNDGTGNNTIAGSSPITDTNWHYIVGVFDNPNNTVSLYVDGVQVASGTQSGSSLTNNTTAATIGGVAGGGDYFKGTIDEPFVSATAISGQKVKQMYEVGYRALQSHSTALGSSAADTNQQLAGTTSTIGDAKPDFNNQFMYVSTSDVTASTGVSQIDLNSDTNVKTFNSTANTPTGGTKPINGTNSSLAVSYNLEAVSASTAGVMSMAPDTNANATSGDFISASFAAKDSFTQAYVWLSAVKDSQDSSNTITVSLSNDGGVTYDQCNLSNTDSAQSPPEYEYFCQMNEPGSTLMFKASMARGSTKTSTYITRYGVGWIDNDSQAAGVGGNGFYTGTNATLADSSALSVTHNGNTNDIILNGWVYENSQWRAIDTLGGVNHTTADTGIGGWWKLNETSGNAADSSGQGSTLTANGTITYRNSSPMDFGTTFDGSTKYFSCTDASCGGTSKTDVGSGDFSAGAWVKFTSTARESFIGKGTAADYSWNMETTSYNGCGTGVAGVVLSTAVGGAYANVCATSVINDNQWHYVTFTWTVSGTSLKIYVDGQLEGTTTSTSGTFNSNTAGNFAVGRGGDTTLYFTGSVDEPFVQHTALTADNIEQLYKLGVSKDKFSIVQTSADTAALYNWTGAATNVRLDVITGFTGQNNGTVSLAPAAADVDTQNFSNAIWINKTGSGGTLLKLQQNGTDVFTITPTYLAAPATATLSASFNPGADNTYSLGASPSARWKDLYLGPTSLHVLCKAGDGAGCNSQTLDWGVGVNTANGNFQIMPNGTSGNNTAKLSINQAGNVGVGITAPVNVLHVSGATSASTTNGAASVASLLSTNALGTGVGAGLVLGGVYTGSSQTGFGQIMGIKENATDANYAGALSFWTRANGASVTEKMRIDSTGNVGIGTTNPQSKLAISLSDSSTTLEFSVAQEALRLTNTDSTNNNWTSMPFYTSSGLVSAAIAAQNVNQASGYSDLAFATRSVTNFSEKMRITSAGNVGIGTTAPVFRFHLLQSSDTSSQGVTLVNAAAANSGRLWMNGADLVLQGGANDNQLVVDSGGNVGIKTTTPTKGNLQISQSADSQYAGGLTIQSGTASKMASYIVDASANTYIFTSGDSGSSYTYAYFGLGASNWTFVSDRRAKENINYIDASGLDIIGKLKPATFSYIGKNRNQAGFIAQDVMEVLPDAVTMDMNGMYGLNEAIITPYLVKGIQELDEKIETNALSTATYSAQLAGLENITLSSTGGLAIAATPDPLRYEIKKDGTVFTQIAALSEAWIANAKVGFLDAQKITIAGEDIKDYIVRIVTEAGFSKGSTFAQGGTLVSPIAQIDRVYTNALSPLPSGNGAITIEGNLAVAGSATISGKLTAQSVAATDASFSGTLRARNIIADNIEGLNARIATISAATLNSLKDSSSWLVQDQPDSGVANAPQNDDFYTMNAASRSALLASLGLLDQQNYFASTSANLGTLIADFGTFNQGLLALGPSSFTDVAVSGQFSVGSLYLNDNSINTLGADLEIQPLAQGGIRIMGGKISINTNGDVQFGEAVEFAKNVRVNGKIIGKVISPIPDEDLVIELGTDGLGDSRFLVKNATGSAVFAVNQKGDVLASGSGTFNKLNFNVIKPAIATGAGDLIAFDAAGVATISATRSEITIHNSLVTEKSLIYLTPVGELTTQPVYLMRQVAGKSFTVGGLAGSVFNWLIIN